MNESRKISRRDWFRLRRKPENRMLSPQPPSAASESLRPIEQPPNHDGLDLSELPPMREALLSKQQVENLFDDIGQLATEIMLMQRSSNGERANGSVVDTASQLETAQSLILQGQIQRLQIRYRWRDSNWIDTLESQPDGFRLVRIEHRGGR